jgi:hypothetical protein
MHVPLRLGESLDVGGWVSGGMAHLQFFGIPSLVVWHLLDLWVRVHLGKRALDGGRAARRRVGAFTHVQHSVSKTVHCACVWRVVGGVRVCVRACVVKMAVCER